MTRHSLVSVDGNRIAGPWLAILISPTCSRGLGPFRGSNVGILDRHGSNVGILDRHGVDLPRAHGRCGVRCLADSTSVGLEGNWGMGGCRRLAYLCERRWLGVTLASLL